MRAAIRSSVVLTVGVFFVGCAGSDNSSGDGAVQGVGGVGGVGGATTSTVIPATGGVTQTSGHSTSGGASTGGASPSASGSTGTSQASGGSNVGGSTASGGSAATASSTVAGGVKATGGSTAKGGAKATGGTTAVSAGGTKASGGSSSAAGATSGGNAGDAKPSNGCGKTPTLKNSPSSANQNALTISGKSRQFLIRWPDNYDKNHPYRLIIGLHGATGKDTDIGPSYFGLWSLSNNSTIFIAPSADGGLWSAATDTTFVDEILKVVEADLCIDTSRILLEGFSQGAAMSWTLACARPGVFRAAIGHSGGGVANPTTCQPIPYLGSLGLGEGNGQNTQTDQFAKWNGCTITTLPRAPTGSHVCTNYTGCPAAEPVRWCSYDGGHTASPNDAGQSSSWMPKEVWSFVSQF